MSKFYLRYLEKAEEYNLAFRVKIDSITGPYSQDESSNQHKVDLPSKWTYTKVDWGDGTTNTEKSHTYTNTGNYEVKAFVSSNDNYLNLGSNNITEILMIPGILNAAPTRVPITRFNFEQNKIPSGGLIGILEALAGTYNSPVDPLSYLNDEYIFIANGQLGYYNKTRPTGQSGGQTYDSTKPLYIPDSTLLASRRTQDELDMGWNLVNKGWRVEMAVDNIYTITMPKSVDDYLADEQGNQKHGYRNVSVFPVFDAATNTLYGRAMKIMDHQYGSYARDERDSSLDGRSNRRSILVPQKLYVYWQFQKPSESTWGHEIPIELTPVPAEGDTHTSIPAGLFTGTYKLAKPIILDRTQFPSGTKVRSMWHQKWNTYAPEKGIKSRLRVTDGLPDNQSLILTLP